MASRIYDNKNNSTLISIIRNSIILSALDKFTIYIYSLIKNGLFGYIFTGYKNDLASSRAKNKKRNLPLYFAEFRYGTCRRIENSFIINAVSSLISLLLRTRLKVYGAYLVSFGVYTSVVSIIMEILKSNISGIIGNMSVMISAIMIFASIPLVMSRKSLAEGICTSSIGAILLSATGYEKDSLDQDKNCCGKMNIGFMLGIISGMLTYWVSPIYILISIFAAIILYIILIRPEVGVVLMFLLMPWLPTMLLAALVAYTTLCYLVKLFRGKRTIQLEPIDFVVVSFIVILLSGGFITLSASSLKPALLMSCLILGYFLTTQLIKSREWLIKCSVACVISGTLNAVLGIAMYFLGIGYSSKAWLDSEMFAGISGRAIGTLGNPNIFGEYLILIIPIAVSMFIGKNEGFRKIPALFCIAILGSALILTWSRGAWLALMIAALLFLFMWHRRSLWVIFAGLASLPILPSLLPESIVSRFMSIGNMADSSTSYRVYIWRASINMIKDNAIAGIGIGEGSWDMMYPLYTYMGVEAAPHSHNLYLQIFLELGVFGIIAFLAFLFLLYQSGFSFFRKLSGNSTLKTQDISETMLLSCEYISTKEKNLATKKQLRISSAGPLCGVFAVLVQGLTDHSWYNYKVFLMFWLVCGLASAYIRSGSDMLTTPADSKFHNDDFSCNLELPIEVERKKGVSNE